VRPRGPGNEDALWLDESAHACTRSELRGASCEDWKSALTNLKTNSPTGIFNRENIVLLVLLLILLLIILLILIIYYDINFEIMKYLTRERIFLISSPK
jgi:hypothetical protein